MPSGVFPTIFFGSLPGGASDGSPAELGGGRASQPLQSRAVTPGGRTVRSGAPAELGGRGLPRGDHKAEPHKILHRYGERDLRVGLSAIAGLSHQLLRRR